MVPDRLLMDVPSLVEVRCAARNRGEECETADDFDAVIIETIRELLLQATDAVMLAVDDLQSMKAAKDEASTGAEWNVVIDERVAEDDRAFVRDGLNRIEHGPFRAQVAGQAMQNSAE